MGYELADLVEEAKQARKHAYVPYSNFSVGAAVLCADGSVFTGCNIENAAYSVTICAERVAIHKAISAGQREFSAIAIICSGDEPCYPCGSCRQVFAEFNPDMTVVMAATGSPHFLELRVSDLLPHAFSSRRLEAGQKPEPPEAPGPRVWP